MEFLAPVGDAFLIWWEQVVEEDDVAGLEALKNAGGEVADISVAAVKNSAAESDGGEVEACQNRLQAWTRNADRWAEQQGADADPGEDLLGFFNVGKEVPMAAQHEQRVVATGVVTDAMAGGEDLADQFGMGGGQIAKDEKGGREPVLGEQFEEQRGRGG